MEAKELMDRLNEITKAEFELGWNLGEIARTVLNDTNKNVKHVVLARQLQDELNSEIREGYVASVSCLGMLTIYQKVNEHGMDMLKTVKTIHSDFSKKLPYSYVMGKKLSKTAYLQTLELLK